MKKLLLFFSLLTSSTIVLQGCGQVGPLYHPDEKAPIYVPEQEQET